MRKLFLAVLFILFGALSSFAEERDASPLEAEYNQKLQMIEEAKKAEPTPEEIAKKQEILKKQEELRFVFSPKQDGGGNIVIPFIMPQGQVIQIPYVSHVPYFFSYVEMFYDGKIMVNETIDMVFKPESPYRNQFVRELNASFVNRMGKNIGLDIQVKSVKINQENVPFVITSFGDKMQIRVFPKEGSFKDGISTFYISYVVDGAVFFTPDFEDIYLDVIGAGFDVPIARAGMTVVFPKNPVVIAQGAYIGSEENPDIALKADRDVEGNLAFAISDPLIPGDDFSVLLTIDKGTLAPPSASDSVNLFIRKNALSATVLLGFIIILLRFVFSYFEAKRNAKNNKNKNTNFSLYASSSLLYFFMKRKVKDETLAVTLMGMAAKGAIEIVKEEDAFKLVKIQDKGLSHEEISLFNVLFKNKNEVLTSDAKAMEEALKMMKCKLSKRTFIEKLKIDKENIISSIILVTLLCVFLGVQTYNYVISSVACLVFVAFIVLLVISLKTFKNGMVLNEYSDKCGKKKLASRLLLMLIILAVVAVLFRVVWGLVSLSSAIGLLAVALLVALYPYFLRGKRLDKKVFDVAEYKEYMKKVFASNNEKEKLVAMYNRHLASAIAIDNFKDYDDAFKASFPESVESSWYKGDSEIDVLNIYKNLSASIAKSAEK